jgi:hypothetical protein
MRLLKIILFFFSIVTFAQNKLVTPYETGNGNQTTTYEQCIAFYQKLDAAFPTIQMIEKGKTDSGKPLHLVLFSADANFESNANKTVILINNGIHPGEPDGIDATMMLLRDLATGKVKAPKNVLFAAIPVYNIGGMLNRNSHSRANQNGPEAYGFRGNARNFDLNRDFIKSDSKNSRSFQAIFSELQPDIFLDNHVSNGADYQYTFTCIATQHERLGGALGEFFINEMYPEMVKDMQKKKIDVVPYVNVYGTTPEKNGFNQFPDTPRYATGYTTLFNTLGFVPETHMLKAYNERVKVTYEFMVSAISYAEKNHAKIKSVRAAAAATYKAGDSYPIDWAIDSSKVSYIDFKGFEAGYKPSDVSGKNRLYYDRSRPFTKKIPFYGKYKATQFVTVPKAYIVPQSQWPVLDLLLLNKMEYSQLKKDTIIEVETYKIAQYETSKSPYEGHYGHYNTKVNRQTEKIQFFAGDYVFSTEQKGMKYLLETLEPEAVDSYFNWNFFDAILQQKEYFSSYVFEDLAKEYLDKNPKIKAELEQKKQNDKAFAENGAAQLDWVYKKSPHYEKAHLLYPVFRVN